MTVAVGANLLFIEGEFEGPVDEQSGDVSVTITPTRFVNDDPEALALTILNLGSTSAYIMLDDTVSSTHGILLVGGGGSVSLNVRDDQTLPARAWWAVTATGTTDLTWLRTRRYALGITNLSP